MCRPVREGALPEAFESGAASARGADPQGSATSRRWLRPANSGSRLTRRRARPRKAVPRGPPRPGLRRETWARRPAFWRRPRPSRLKTGSVRTHLRRRSPRGSPSRAGWRRSAGPGTKSAARGVRRNPPDGGADLPILPFARSRRPAREKTRPALPSLLSRGTRRLLHPPGRLAAAGTRTRAQPRRRRRLTAFVSRSTVQRRGEGAPLEAMMGQRDRSLRQYLMAYGAALLVPVLLLAVVLVWQFARAEEVQNEEKARAAAQQNIAAVDRELAGLQAAGLALASAAALRAGNFERVQRRAAEIIRALPHPQNYAIVVRDLTGQQLVNTRVPWGTPLPKGADPDADKEVIDTRLPFVQDLFTGATANRPVLSVRVPVLADESVTHVLSVAFEPAHIAGIIGEQNLPTAWTATVLDRNSRVIARSQRHAQYFGIVPAEGFGAAEARENRAWRGISLEGEPVLGAFAQSKLSGWRAFVGVPERVVRAPLWRSLWLIAALAAVLLAISFLLAFWFGRRIARPIQRLAREARALGRGQPVHAFASGVREPDLVSAAMAAAHQELAAREAALRASEGRLRATAENAAVGIVEVDPTAASCASTKPSAGSPAIPARS